MFYLKNTVLLLFVGFTLTTCNQPDKTLVKGNNKELSALFEIYHEESLQLFPLNATYEGDNRYNDLLPIDFSDSYRHKLKGIYLDYLAKLEKFDKDNLNTNDKLSYDILNYTLRINIEGFKFNDNYIPFNQFWGLPLDMGQFGSGEGAQPFKTVKDYDDWVKRATAFSIWADSSIVYFRKGMATGFVLPKSLVIKIVPQLEAMIADKEHVKNSLFYSPVNKFPNNFNEADKKRLTEDYTKLVNEQISPTYKKLADFLKNEYLPKARTTSGIGSLPDGKAYYEYLVRRETTTDKTPEEIYNIGLAEVNRLHSLMESVKNEVGFKGDLPAFFEYMNTDKKFMPYKTPEEVLAAFHKIHEIIKPNLEKMFIHVPRTKFEIRQTEAFRAASADAGYTQGTPDGSRPGIFYIPILDATKFNKTNGMESLFLHEAIPGHHYQISLQQEDTMLPKFRRFGGQNAYVEGWALYCESLGKELGLFTDPYQYMGALQDEIHRAIRLVVDVAIHTKGMTREEAIKYMMINKSITEKYATSEIERYMAIPGQALGYKIGALKFQELRNRYEKQLGTKFKLAAFHYEVLKDASMPLALLEIKMNEWAKSQR